MLKPIFEKKKTKVLSRSINLQSSFVYIYKLAISEIIRKLLRFISLMVMEKYKLHGVFKYLYCEYMYVLVSVALKSKIERERFFVCFNRSLATF